MGYPFKCAGCGKPRSYINQYCDNCESTGPHIPVSSPDRVKRAYFKPKKRSDPISKPPERKIDVVSGIDDDRDMRSLYARKAPRPRLRVNRSVLQKGAAVLAAVVFVAAIVGAIVSLDLPGKFSWPVQKPSVVPADNKTAGIAKNQPSTVATDNQNINSTAKNNDAVKPPLVTAGGSGGNIGPVPTDNKTSAKPGTSGVAVSGAVATPPAAALKPQITAGPTAVTNDFSVTIIWKTNVKTTSFVKYGPDTTYPFPSIELSDMKPDHSIFLEGLAPNTLYHYKVVSTDAAGNTVASSDNTFRTELVTDSAPYMGSRAPDFTLKDLRGNDVSLSHYLGKKIILNFWASWCTPCKIELPHLQAVWDKYQDSPDFVLLTVAGSGSDEDAIRDYIAQNNYTFEVCLDSGDSVFNNYEIVSIPKTYFIDKGGVIRRIQQGMFTSPSEVEFMLETY